MQSATNKHWVDRLSAEQLPIAQAIVQRFGVDEVAARIIASRGVGLGDVSDFLAPSLRNQLPDPLTLTDMAPAAQRLADAVMQHQRVTIFGDYDVDGACSSALVALFCAHFGVQARIYIPDRITEGYGPNVPAIEEIYRDGCDLLVTVDCGATSFVPLEAAKALNLDVIVLDHHQMGADWPPAIAVVNPNRQDDVSGMGHLCAAGVVFLCLVATVKLLRAQGAFEAMPEPDLLKWLDCVALATVADVVPLTGLNRAFVRQGLKIMAHRRNVGLAALADSARVYERPAPYHLGYILGPRINAGGRIGDAGLGARLLTTRNEAEAAEIAAVLERLNAERQAIEKHHVDEAIAQMEATLIEKPYALAYGQQWHVGVAGLVAARLKERFSRPAFALAAQGDVATGSARSVAGVDLGAIVREGVATGLLLKGGGHAMAAGLTINMAQFPAFEDFLHEKLNASFGAVQAHNAQLPIDAYISARTATTEFIYGIEALGPYGSAMPEPVFGLMQHTLAFVDVLKNDHMRLTLKSKDGATLKAMAWRAASSDLGEFLQAHRGKTVNIAGTLSVDSWQGKETPALRVVDAAI